jgi:hypothetical protein
MAIPERYIASRRNIPAGSSNKVFAAVKEVSRSGSHKMWHHEKPDGQNSTGSAIPNQNGWVSGHVNESPGRLRHVDSQV